MLNRVDAEEVESRNLLLDRLRLLPQTMVRSSRALAQQTEAQLEPLAESKQREARRCQPAPLRLGQTLRPVQNWATRLPWRQTRLVTSADPDP